MNRRKSFEKLTFGYTLRDPFGQITYIGISNDTDRRALEHKKSKIGRLKVETPPLPRKLAKQWESDALKTYRRFANGKNPPHNKTLHG